MNEREKLIKLYDIYKNLLTDKQKEYFEYYYFEDYSLSEISENLNVSKTIVGKTIKTVENKLLNFEKSLNLHTLNNSLIEISKKTKDPYVKEELNKLIK